MLGESHSAEAVVWQPESPANPLHLVAARTELINRLGPLIGASGPMQSVYDLIGRVASTGAGVLLSGETGTGKELVAQTIHSLSRRSKKAFVALNCGGVSPTLIESELFGHERGSFTGAERLHKGYFERADGGTLFLDEITEMPADLQIKLLRVLETSLVSRVGGTRPIAIDVRIIAATNQPPERAVAEGRLRQDLLYRLNVFPLTMPPLRERGDDVVLLAGQFLGALNAAEGTVKCFTAACLERLRRHPWPGNVRELRNVVHRAYILADQNVGADSLPFGPFDHCGGLVSAEPAGASLVTRLGTSLADTERRLILATLGHLGGDKPDAARALGISIKTLYNRLRQYEGMAERAAKTG